MHFICGSFQVKIGGEFRDYSDLDEYVSKSGIEGIMLGEDARDFMSFFGIEVDQPFTGMKFRIGVILDNRRGALDLCPIHDNASLAIGMNSSVQIVGLNPRSVVARFDVDSCLHHLLCNGRVLAAVHELGAVVIRVADFHEIANLYCEVVADATMANDVLTLVSMNEETTHVALVPSSQG